MKPLPPKEAARRAKRLMERHPKCAACGSSDWLTNERGDISCRPCWKSTLVERAAEIRRRMK